MWCLCFRGGAEQRRKRTSALPGRRVAIRNNCYRLRHEAQAAHNGGGVQARQKRAADHISEPQLHGPAAGVGAGAASHGRHVREPLRPRGLQARLPSVPLDSPVQRGGLVRL